MQAPKPIAEHSFHEFCELIEIRLKDGNRRSFAPSTWHEEQARFDAERTGRDVVVKPRQVGFSTLELARDLWTAIRRPAAQVLIVGHDADLMDQLFVALRIFEDCLDRRGMMPARRYSNKREIVFRSGSAVRIVEAGDTAFAAEKKGRSGTVHRLHLTEQAFWKAPEATMGSLMQSVPADGEIVNESTTNGAAGLFYKTVMAARVGSRDKLHFFPWYEHAEYRSALPPGFEPAPRDEWEQKLRDAGCDDEQLQWWRERVDDPAIGLERMLQEFPIDLESCFRHRDMSLVVVPEFDVGEHVKRSEVPRYYRAYVGLDPGSRDFFGIVWGYWDFERQVLVIQRSWAEPNVTTTPIAELVKQTERELWSGSAFWDGKREHANPYLRVSDTDARFIGDMCNEHGLPVAPTAKDDADAQLVSLRNAFIAHKIEIWPDSGPLAEQLIAGRWNPKRTDWERTAELGHLDCVSALVYLWRNVVRTLNPNRPASQRGQDLFVAREERRNVSSDAAVVERALSIGKAKTFGSSKRAGWRSR